MAARPRRSAHIRIPLLHRLRRRHLLPLLALLLLLLPLLSALLLRSANSLGRRCLPPATGHYLLPGPRLSFSIVTLSDEGASGHGARGRSFRGVLAAAAPNKRAYAAARGYDLAVFPAAAVDPRRPPSWSKVSALRSRLHRHHWLFWNDADTLVTNPDITLEMVLFSVIGHTDFHASPDLILTEDINGVNSGLFFIRRSKWSERFLDTWWNHTSFVQFGSTKSGDNAALKHIIDHLSPEETQAHVRIAKMQCLFNSYPWRATWKSVHRLIFHLSTTWKVCRVTCQGTRVRPPAPARVGSMVSATWNIGDGEVAAPRLRLGSAAAGLGTTAGRGACAWGRRRRRRKEGGRREEGGGRKRAALIGGLTVRGGRSPVGGRVLDAPFCHSEEQGIELHQESVTHK